MFWFVTVVLILINALYVMAEFSAVSARRSALNMYAQDTANSYSRLAKSALLHLENPILLDRYIAAAQIGITLTSIILGAYMQYELLVPVSNFVSDFVENDTAAVSLAAVLIVLAFTAIQMVFGELLPKSLSLQFPIASVVYTYPAMRFSLIIFSGAITVLNGSGNGILRIFKVPLHSTARTAHSKDELDAILEESHEEGFLEDEEHERLRVALTLTERTAREIMVPRREMAAIDLAKPQEDIWQMIVDTPYTRLPVYNDNIDEILGVLSTRDALLDYIKRGKKGDVNKFIAPATFVPETVTTDLLLATMREKRCHICIVLDEFGGTEGLVTLEDVLAEIFGAMNDEFKELEEKEPKTLGNGDIELPGNLLLDELKKYTNIDAIETNEVDTVSGLLFHITGQVAEVGQRIELEDAFIEVTEVKNNAAKTVHLSVKKEEKDG